MTRPYESRHNPEWVTRVQLARELGWTNGVFYNQIYRGWIPEGDIVHGRRFFYSQKLANEIIKKWEKK